MIDYEKLSTADRRALSGLHDSKQLTEEGRDALFPAVLRAATRVAVVIRSARGIDDRGLHNTNIEALGTALERLGPDGEATCLVDGFSLRNCSVPHRALVGGDGTSAAIAAASVLAKVTRDRYMRVAADEHPGWGFEEHVGYSTPEHREAIERIGISPLHRRSFQSVAYSQLELGGVDASEGAAEVLEVRESAVALEDDADGVEADLREAG
jgi:ribonuclease HII